MKRIGIIVVLGLFLGFAPALHAEQMCNTAIPESTPAADFTDHGDGTVTHSRTGLMWKRCAEGQTWSGGACTGTASTATWANALRSAVSATTAGHSDWRLPNIKELQSIIEEKCYSPSINGVIFPGTPAFVSGLWSASALAYDSGYAWFVLFADGGAYGNRKSGAVLVRLVRAGQSFGSFDSSNITIGSASQTISFGSAPTIAVGGTGTVSATATSGLPVSFSSLTTSVCTVSGSTVTGIAAGTCTLAANQAGNANYAAASQVTQNITIGATISDARVFAFAEANFLSLFTVPATAGQYLQFNYRHYPASGNYLAIDTAGVIYILGTATGGVLTAVGPVESFRSYIIDWEATP